MGPRDNNKPGGRSGRFAVQIIVTAAGICLLSYACYRAIRLAYADHLFYANSLESVARAAESEPGSAQYQIWLAELLEEAGRDPGPALRAAAAASPEDAMVWIRSGLWAEVKRDYEQAERDLLRAAAASRKYDPRWTLANYYFRRGDRERFWEWARAAFTMSYGDRRPLFLLCWRMQADAETILRRAIPERRPVLKDYAAFLMSEQQWRTAERLFVKLAEGAESREAAFFLNGCDQLLAQSRVEAAESAWNSLCRRRVVPYRPLQPERGAILTNGDFAFRSVSHGFDWRTPAVAGVDIAQAARQGGWRISFDGDQPEHCEVLNQPLLTRGGRKYRLRYSYRFIPAVMAAETGETGVRWRIYGDLSGSGALGESKLFSGEEAKEESFDFTVPEGAGATRLALVYERAPGTVRLEGSVELRQAAVELSE